MSVSPLLLLGEMTLYSSLVLYLVQDKRGVEEGLKNRAYLEGLRLKNQGLEKEIIYARLEKQGIPEELAHEVANNIFLQQKIEKKRYK